MSRVVCIIQARMTSQRLPGKVLADICGKPMVQHVIERCFKASRVNQFVLLTPTGPENDVLARLADHLHMPCYRGDDVDVLSGYYGAAFQHEASIVVRITADCPLVWPGTIDHLIRLRECCDIDYASNEGDCRGFDAEVFTFTELQRAFRLAVLRPDRVHVTPLIIRTAAKTIAYKSNAGAYRLCVDVPSDLKLVRRIVSRLGSLCSPAEVLQLLESHPDLVCNAHIKQKAVEEG